MFIDILIAFIAIVVYKISELFNYDAYGFKEVHEICGFLFIIMLIFHISYNWQWVKTQIFGKKPEKKKNN
jgi:hypothetical protein